MLYVLETPEIVITKDIYLGIICIAHCLLVLEYLLGLWITYTHKFLEIRLEDEWAKNGKGCKE